ncbi:hypothetical protein EDF70_101827 [Neorhizobium sp. JUb45]|nr:hypothetical protein EDF70_101827 [Neorhizobium sp. JUb45]
MSAAAKNAMMGKPEDISRYSPIRIASKGVYADEGSIIQRLSNGKGRCQESVCSLQFALRRRFETGCNLALLILPNP